MLFGRSGGNPWGLPSEIAEEEARHNSIITSGYDPAFGRFRGEVEMQSCRDGICYGVTLNKPTLETFNAYLNASILWAAGPAGFAQGQLQLAGAGGAVVTLQWIAAGGATILSTPVLVTAGVVVGVAAVGYGGYLAYRYFKIPKVIRDAAGAVGVSARALGDAVEQFKNDNKLPPNFNLDYSTIVTIAEALKRGEYYTK